MTTRFLTTSSCTVDADLPRSLAIDRQETPLSRACSMDLRSLLSSLAYLAFPFFLAMLSPFPRAGGTPATR